MNVPKDTRVRAAKVVNLVDDATINAEIDMFAARDAQPDEDRSQPREVIRAGRRTLALAKEVQARVSEPWIDFLVGPDSIGRLRLGSIGVVTGPPGAGKTTLALTIAVEHVNAGGVTVFLSLELDGDELVARIVGFKCDASWESVLRGAVVEHEMQRVLDMPRFTVLDGDAASLKMLEVEVAAMREEFGDIPILVVVDYLQIMSGDDDTIRARVAANAQQLRRLAKRLRVVVLEISQPSRAAGKALSAGEVSGAETMTTGAESAEIERAAYLTFAIGSAGPVREDGTRSVELHVGKGRFGGGDRVWPMTETPHSGLWRIAGAARPAAEVKAERETERSETRVEAAYLAMLTAAERASEPMTRTELRKASGCAKAIGDAAINRALDRRELFEVRSRKPRAHEWRIWTKANAEAAGVPLIEVSP